MVNIYQFRGHHILNLHSYFRLISEWWLMFFIPSKEFLKVRVRKPQHIQAWHLMMYFHKRQLSYSWKKTKETCSLTRKFESIFAVLCVYDWSHHVITETRATQSTVGPERADSVCNYLWSWTLIPITIDIIAAVQIRVNRIVVTSNITYVSGGYLVEIVRMSKPYRQHQ